MKFFRDTSISNKILIPPAIMIIALGTILLLAIHGLNKQSFVLSHVHDIALERITLVNEFISLSESVESDLFRITVLRFMNVPEPEIQAIHEHLGQGLSDMSVIYRQILSKWHLDQEEKKILQQMNVPMDAFTQEAQQATAVVSQNPSFGIFLVRSAAVPFADFQKFLSQFLDYQKRKIAHAETVSRKTMEKARTTITVIGVLTAFIAILSTIWIGRRLISHPVRSITAAMGQLADGNLSTDVGDLNRKDEIGSMAKVVEVFRQNAMEKKAAEEAFQESQRRLTTLMSNLPGMAYRCKNDLDWTMEFVSDGCLPLTGYRPRDLVGNALISYDEMIHPEDRAMVWAAVQAALKNKRPFELLYRIITTHREKKWVWEQGRGIFGAEGNVIALEGFITDITELKAAEKKIKASLREKEVLLREIHHRVKNNMQVITSLLRLQSHKIKDPRFADIIRESQGRIKSMTLIHEKLYQSKDLAKVDFNKYIKSLMNRLFRSHGIDTGRIITTLKVEDVSLGLDRAIPCGLIINELISNSLKYAFPEDRNGKISVTLRSITEGEIELAVSDDGIGIREDLDFRSIDSFGLDLVSILVEDQLEGKIDLDRTGGTTFRILFKGER